jgi:kynureninase
VRHADVWDAVEVLGEILDSESWRDPRYQTVAAVT